jgi:hypothetical protein
LLGREVPLKDVEDRVVQRFSEVFQLKPEVAAADRSQWQIVSTVTL